MNKYILLEPKIIKLLYCPTIHNVVHLVRKAVIKLRTKYNRFALVPVLCTDCHTYVWMEFYRKSEVFRPIAPSRPSFQKKNICKKCISKYDVEG